MAAADQAGTALFLSAFFDELIRGGVRAAVVSPGSRSTPLAMVAYEAQQRFRDFRVVVDVDERGAAFVALGMAKASGVPVCVVCTSGTAVANYYPAVMEAESSRVPLLVLTGDRPPRLQDMGAPQTCDQIKAFGSHVALFRQMPLPEGGAAGAAFARQAAREALRAAGGMGAGDECAAHAAERVGGQAADGAPVHLNFPFEEPLKPDLGVPGLFEVERSRCAAAPLFTVPPRSLTHSQVEQLDALMRGKRTMVLAGEGSVRTQAEAEALIAWANERSLPLAADPLSGLRSFADSLVIDNYDNVFGADGFPQPDVVIRFGRWPVSKRCAMQLSALRPVQVVVDPQDTRDFTASTDCVVACTPPEFVRSMRVHGGVASSGADVAAAEAQRAFADAWVAANDREREHIEAADASPACDEGPFVRRLLAGVPSGSCLFAASSMSVRAVDTFYTKGSKRVRVLCNRGLNGIDGTVSSAVGAALEVGQVTLLTGDLALLHDVNALALQRELLAHHVPGQGAASDGAKADEAVVPSVVVVLLNNNGGGIFDMLPQQSDEPYFERLFLTPQDVQFKHAAAAFSVPYCAVGTPDELEAAYANAVGTPGLSVIEVKVPLSGVKERYGTYW